jgi:hypothetical protein
VKRKGGTARLPDGTGQNQTFTSLMSVSIGPRPRLLLSDTVARIVLRQCAIFSATLGTRGMIFTTGRIVTTSFTPTIPDGDLAHPWQLGDRRTLTTDAALPYDCFYIVIPVARLFASNHQTCIMITSSTGGP